MAGLFGQAANMFFGTLQAATDLARGWGKNMKWVSLKEGQQMAREQNKPAMVVIHKTWCRACKALKPRFSNSREIEQLSQNFVMINVEDDEEPKSAEYKPDGGYIPRILFLDPNGNVMSQVTNETNQTQWKYFYGETSSIADSMKKVLKKVGSSGSATEQRQTRNTRPRR